MVVVLLVAIQCKAFGRSIAAPRLRAAGSRARLRRYLGVSVCAAVAAVPGIASGFGPDGHRLVGRLAEPRLCAAADSEVRRLGGDGLEALGQWADGIRGDPRWAHTRPWHYMNVADRAAVEARRPPPAGDVLWAIGHFEGVLADRRASRERRSQALRFLTHFVADVHQPLHVGREADRGGNTIELRAAGRRTNLHRFWDSDVIRLRARRMPGHADALRRRVETRYDEWSGQPPVVWAAESHALRPAVYDFEPGPGRRLDPAYVERAGEIIDRRLAQAAVRLAATLNRLFCLTDD